jgi:hypothetical protein
MLVPFRQDKIRHDLEERNTHTHTHTSHTHTYIYIYIYIYNYVYLSLLQRIQFTCTAWLKSLNPQDDSWVNRESLSKT